MAEKLTVPGTQVVVKPRNPVAVGFLSLTGVYIPFYWYFINKELKELGEARGIDLGTSPGVSAAAMFPGFLLLFIPCFWTAYTTTERVKTAQIATGRKDWLEGWISLVVFFMLAPLMYGFVQDQLNKVWQNLGLDTPYPKTELPQPGYGYQYPPQQPPGEYQPPQPYNPPPPPEQPPPPPPQ